MKITLEPTLKGMQGEAQYTDRVVSVELPDDDLTIQDVLEFLIKSVLLAWGYQQGSIDKIVYEDNL